MHAHLFVEGQLWDLENDDIKKEEGAEGVELVGIDVSDIVEKEWTLGSPVGIQVGSATSVT